jgi:hypothetical protein
MSSTQVVVIVVVVVVLLAVIAIAAWTWQRRRTALRERFGPEYQRVVSEKDGSLAGERELRARERRHAELELRPLSAESRQRYTESWEEIQARFVDAPKQAVGEADELLTRLIAERGYPTGDYDEQVAQLSVDHARTLEYYRQAHEINLSNERGEATTEQLRQALVYYRSLFTDLVEGQPAGEQAPDEVRAQAPDGARAQAADDVRVEGRDEVPDRVPDQDEARVSSDRTD